MVFKQIDNLDDFYSIIMNKENENNLIIAYFTATWCGPCKQISPVIQNIGENNEFIIVLKIDVDEASEISDQYKIDCMPTFKFFKNCNIEECFSCAGANETNLINNIKNILSEDTTNNNNDNNNNNNNNNDNDK